MLINYAIEKNMKSKTIPGFKERCICLWSKDNEFGFIPFKECPVHGKQVKESLERMKPYHYVGEDVKCDLDVQEKKK